MRSITKPIDWTTTAEVCDHLRRSRAGLRSLVLDSKRANIPLPRV